MSKCHQHPDLEALRVQNQQRHALLRRTKYEIGKKLVELNATHESLKISRRTADYNRSFFRIVQRTKAEHLIERIEIGKLTYFEEILNEENIEFFVEYCENRNKEELKEIAKDFEPLTLLNEKRAPKHRGEK